jgi:hypothetical protein
MDDQIQTTGSTQPPATPAPGNWLDRQAKGYSDWMFWLHLLICQCPGFIVGVLFLAGCVTPEGKAVGTRLLKFSAIGVGVGFLINILIAVLSSMR